MVHCKGGAGQAGIPSLAFGGDAEARLIGTIAPDAAGQDGYAVELWEYSNLSAMAATRTFKLVRELDPQVANRRHKAGTLTSGSSGPTRRPRWPQRPSTYRYAGRPSICALRNLGLLPPVPSGRRSNPKWT